MKLGISLVRAHPHRWLDIAVAADELGFDSVWISDHLVIPATYRSRYPGAENAKATPHVSGSTGPSGDTFPILDCPAFLAAAGARTSRIGLGTYVYLLGLRHPLITARAFQTVEYLSGGRLELGVGAGWLEEEWRAIGMDWKSRGAALDEAIAVCRRLWTEPTVGHRGAEWSFEPVWFEPKPPRPDGPPILVGGETTPALRRAALHGDGWIGMEHTPDTVRVPIKRLYELLAEICRPRHELTLTVTGIVENVLDVERWEQAGVDRVIISPWERSRDAIAGMTALASRLGL